MKRKKILLLLLILMITIAIVFHIRNSTKQNSSTANSKFHLYKRFSTLIENSEPEKFEYIGEITLDDALYYQYHLSGITLLAENTSNNLDNYFDANYKLLYNDSVLPFTNQAPNHPESISIYYVDINEDNEKDVVIIGEPYSGTNSAYYWFKSFDITSLNEINVFRTDKESVIYLTDEQNDNLLKMLSCDKDFLDLFPDFEWFGNYAHMMVDSLGKIYYEIGLGKDLFTPIGRILVLFDFNKEAGCYDVVDYIYIRHY